MIGFHPFREYNFDVARGHATDSVRSAMCAARRSPTARRRTWAPAGTRAAWRASPSPGSRRRPTTRSRRSSTAAGATGPTHPPRFVLSSAVNSSSTGLCCEFPCRDSQCHKVSCGPQELSVFMVCDAGLLPIRMPQTPRGTIRRTTSRSSTSRGSTSSRARTRRREGTWTRSTSTSRSRKARAADVVAVLQVACPCEFYQGVG